MRIILLSVIILLTASGCITPQKWGPVRDTMYQQGDMAYLRQDFKSAAKLFRDFAQFGDQQFRGQARFWEGMSRLQTGEYVEAREAFCEVIESDPPVDFGVRSLLGLGRAALGLEEYDKAEKLITEALEEDPDVIPKSFAMLKLAFAAMRQGKWGFAGELCKEIVADNETPDLVETAEVYLQYVNIAAFTVQVGAYSSKASARYEADRLRKEGLNVRVEEFTIKSRRLYTVLVGSYETFGRADNARRHLRRRGLVKDAVVKP